jgi:hypothetical protein
MPEGIGTNNMTRIEHLESRIDALEEAIRGLTGRKVEPSDREYMRLFLRGDKEGAKAMLRELDRRGGMQRQSSVCLTGEESRTAAARG